MAISVSDAFKQAMKSPVKLLRASIVTDESSPQTITSADNLVSFTVEANGYLFGAAISAITIKLIGTNYNLVGVGLNVQFEVQTDPTNDLWDALNYGRFRIYEQTVDLEKGMTTLKGFDFMGTIAQSPYIAGDITFPCTVADLAQQIAARFAISISTDMTTLPNYDYTITEDLYALINGVTYRDILAEIAGATATMAIINGGDGTLDFIPAQMTPSETWTYDNLRKIKFEPKYGVVNAVVLSRTPQEDNIAVKDEVSISENGMTDIKLANNEILDDDRQLLAQPILDAVNGFFFYPFEASTEGHGWHECGDRIAVTDGTNTWEVIVTDVKVEIGQGIKETIKGVAPTRQQTDYARAGGIMKTIYNTEIKVDKQAQQIESVVSRQDEFEGETQDNFTQVIQNITNVITSVQNSGGANLIRNSVGYFLNDSRLPLVWNTNLSGGALTIAASSEAINYGSLSGNIMTLAGASIAQRITVVPDNGTEDSPRYSFSVRVKKGAVGTGQITLSDGIETYTLSFAAGDDSYYDQFSITNILPKNNYLNLTVSGSSDSDFTVTDMMLAVGEFVTQWTQANGEFANTQVNIDINGVTVASSTVQGSRTLQSPFQFGGYQNGNLTYSLDASAVKSDKALLTSGIEMPPLKIVAMDSGWAWVSMEGSN
jgi:hypothetical protein